MKRYCKTVTRTITLLLCLTRGMVAVFAFLLTTVAAYAQSGYWTDHVTVPDQQDGAYIIDSAEKLAWIAQQVNSGSNLFQGASFIQRADIDLSAHLWVPIGKDATNTFLGNYAGQGHTIKNMTIDETYTGSYPVSGGAAPGYGLFGSVNGTGSYATNSPVIQNVVLVTPRITINTAGYNKYTRIGMLVGALGNNSTLKNCNVQGGQIIVSNLNGQTASANMFIGGAVGDCAPGFTGFSPNTTPINIQNISIDADITVQGTNAQGNYQYNIGGIVGRMRYSRGPLVNCYYTGKIDAPQFTVSPSYGAMRNNGSSSTIANIMAGQFYDAAERTGTKVYFGDYKVKYNNDYRTITGNPTSGYTFEPASAGNNLMTRNTVSGINVWTFGIIPTAQQSTLMAGAQGVNSCDTYVSTTDEYNNLVDDFNNGISVENIMRYKWFDHDGKLLLERLDEATLSYDEASNTLTLSFTAPASASNITYHWRRGAEEMTEHSNTYHLPAKTLTDITWHAYASYQIGGKTYYSSVPEYTQVAKATMPTVTLSGTRTDNNLALTTTLNDPDGVTTSGVTYHWIKDAVTDSHTEASFNVVAFTPEDVVWQVYATFTHEGTEYTTEPATYTQTVPQINVTTIPNGENIDITINFDNYGGTITGITYNWDYNIYYADGEVDGEGISHTSDEVKETIKHSSTTSNTYQVSAVIFEERLWHVYVDYTYSATNYETSPERYNQAPKAIPTLNVSKDPSSGTQLVMTATLVPNYTSVTPTYHWSKNGVEQTDHYNAQRTVPHAFDTQLWRCWATFTYDGKEYRTNDDTYTYYSTLGELHFTTTNNDGTIVATLQEAGSFASNIQVAYTWKDSQGNNGTGTSYTRQGEAEWVEFIATITDTNNGSNQLIKYAVYRFPNAAHNVVYINYTGGANGNDANPGVTRERPVKTWKRAYELLDDSGWEKNIIVIVHGTGSNTMLITEADAQGKEATITGEWPWGNTFTPNDDNTGRVNVTAGTSLNTGARIGAATRFKNVVFWGTNSSQNRFSCWLHDTYFDTGVVMKNFDTLDKSAGAIADRKSPHFHLQLYGDQLAKDDFPQGVNEHMTLTIRSGQFGRILASRIAGTKAKNTYIIGRHNNPLKATINIDIQDIAGNKSAGGVDYTDDIGYIASGLTQGMMYGDITMNITRGSIATLVSASQGNALRMGDLKTPVSTFCGRTTININANEEDVVIQNYYGGCQGRVYGSEGVCDAYLYGQSTLNMNGGTIKANIFASSAGISGLRSADPDYYAKGWYTPDQRIPYPGTYAFGIDYLPYDRNKKIVTMTNTMGEDIDLSDTEIKINIQRGRVEGSVYGGSYGNSDPLDNVNYAPVHAGRLFGNTSVNISGGTILGNVYGGGSGSSRYFDMATTDARREDFLHVAQVYGNTHVNITGSPSIQRNIYGGGAGIPYQTGGGGKTENEFLDIAKVYGNTNVTIDADPTWEYRGNIYGGGAMGAVEGTTTVTIKSGTILGNVFGGGKGEDGHPDKAKVTGATKVLIGE